MRKSRLDPGNLAEDIFIELIDVYNSTPKDVVFKRFDFWLQENVFEKPSKIIPLKNRGQFGEISYSPTLDFSNPGLPEEWVNSYKIYPALHKYISKNSENVFDVEEKLDAFDAAKSVFDGIIRAKQMESIGDFSLVGVGLPGGYIAISGGSFQLSPPPHILNIIYSCARTGYLNRIRLCQQCEKLYWAKRSNAKYCSAKCVAAYNQKNYLEKDENRERVNAQRRENYQTRRKLELIKSSNNGAL